VLELARCDLDTGQPAVALRVLADAPPATDWFADRVNPALVLSLESARCQALAGTGDPAGARARLDIACAVGEQTLGSDHRAGLDARRTLAGIIAALGDPVAARDLLLAVQQVERAAGEAVEPGTMATVLALGQVGETLGDLDSAWTYIKSLSVLVDVGVDPRHPTMLAGQLLAARLEVLAGASQTALERLAPILDRSPHGVPDGPSRDDLPALEDGHPVLVAAQEMRRRIRGPAGGSDERVHWLGEE
jgi:hypothetical protein